MNSFNSEINCTIVSSIINSEHYTQSVLNIAKMMR